ncbi:MAG: hypothetical protein KBD65_03760 [Candidatus Moranbacteria bacterium]|nr:hypothetical protein [Candidatus Moranbacteria bacterium]
MIKLLQWGIEGVVALAILIFVYSQVLRPLFRGTPAFPMFRRRPNTERQIEEVNEQLEDKQLQRELADRQRQLGKKK